MTDIRSGDPHGERLPPMQHRLDNPFLLLFIGGAVPAKMCL